MRVLVNAVSAKMGGAVRHLPPFLEAMKRLHPDDEIILAKKPPQMPRLMWDQWGVNGAVKHERADVLLSLLNFGPVHCPVPHVLCQRNPVYFHPILQKDASLAKRTLAHIVMRSADIVVTPSHTQRAAILKTHPDLDAVKVRVVYHGVDRSVFYPNPLKDGPELTGPRPVVLYVSHRAPWKGHTTLKEACADLPVELMMADNVPQDEVPNLYRQADIFAFPSWGESFGLPMLEAMASGLPIVAADTPVNREILGGDGPTACAMFFPVGDVKALRHLLGFLTRTPDVRAEMGRNGLERSEKFTWERCAREMMSVIREVTNVSADRRNNT